MEVTTKLIEAKLIEAKLTSIVTVDAPSLAPSRQVQARKTRYGTTAIAGLRE